MNYLLVDRPNPVTPQGTFPRRGGNVLSGTCIVHTSEGPWSNGVDPLTNFIRTRADYGSYHRACDWADIAAYFPWEWEAWQDSETNPWAVGISAACRTSDWAIMPADVREGYYRNMGRMAADFVEYMRTMKGIHVPLKRITGAEARARVPGFCAHGDSGVSRSDPGADFDWGYFFKCTAEALGGASIAPQANDIQTQDQEWYLMPNIPKDNLLQIEAALMSKAFGGWLQSQVMSSEAKSTDGKRWPLRSFLYGLTHRQQQISGELAGLREAVRQVADAQGAELDYNLISAAARIGSHEALKETNQINAAAIADAVVDEQAERLTQKEQA